jgi:hypothetical protein
VQSPSGEGARALHKKCLKIATFCANERLFVKARHDLSARLFDWRFSHVKLVCRKHTKIELLYREGKLVTGLERCQCRKARIQRNHIGSAFLVWGRLKELAVESGRTIYQLKHGLLDDYLIQQLMSPSLKMALA